MRWTRSLKYSFLNAMVPVMVWLLRGLGATLRRSWHDADRLEHFLSQSRPGIGAFFHCDLPTIALWGMEMARQGRPITVLTSPSRDGQIFARFLQKLGIRTVKGSSSKRGVQGMLALVRALQEGHHIGIVVDGPRGPRGTVKKGVIWLSRRTGAPVFPFAMRIRPKITLPTWDRAEIPLPFARYDLFFGEPYVPPESMAEACQGLAECLQRLKGESPAPRPYSAIT